MHEVAGRINPAAKVAYVDFDPIVLVHARALLADPSRTIVIEGEVRDPAGILADPNPHNAPEAASLGDSSALYLLR